MASELGVQTIQHTNGTDALTIDASGNVTTQQAMYPKGLTYWPAFKVGIGNRAATGSLRTLSGSGGDTLTLNTRDAFDNGSNFSTTTGAFTAPIDGLYTFTFSAMRFNLSGSTADFRFKLNGAVGNSSHARLYFVYDNAYDSGCMTSVMNLSAGDYITVEVGADASIYEDDSWFCGHYIGG